jgi:formylglycine-generating enzyme required for sulfatase activity
MNTPPNRVLRGGDWDNDGGDCRSANRGGIGLGFRGSLVGFRPVLKPMTPTKL